MVGAKQLIKHEIRTVRTCEFEIQIYLYEESFKVLSASITE